MDVRPFWVGGQLKSPNQCCGWKHRKVHGTDPTWGKNVAQEAERSVEKWWLKEGRLSKPFSFWQDVLSWWFFSGSFFFHKDLLSCLLKLTHPRNYDLLVLWDHPLHIFEPHNQQLWDSNTQSLTTALRDSARRGCHNPLCLTWVFTAPWDLHTSKNPPQYTSRLGHLVRYIQSFGDISSLQKKSI